MALAARQGPDVIHLEVGEPDFPTPPVLIDAGLDAARAGFTRYTPNAGLSSLRERIVEKLQRENGLDVSRDEVVVTPGGVFALASSVLATVDAGEEVLLPDPGWPNYESMVLLGGAVPVRYELDRYRGFMPNVNGIRAQITSKTKMLVINSPGNPTGAVFSESVVRELVEVAREFDLYILSDEVYESFVYDGRHVPAATFDIDGRVITVFSFSKTYAMTGWRLGYAVATPELTMLIAKLQEPLVSCSSSVSQKVAEAAIDLDPAVVAAMRSAYQRRVDIAADELGHLLAARPQGAFYALVDVSSVGNDSYAVARDLLQRELVATAPGETFGPNGAGLLRISIASSDTHLREGCRRISAYVRERAGDKLESSTQ